jgi:hypothetical protein
MSSTNMVDSFITKENADGTIRITSVMSLTVDQKFFNDILIDALRGPIAHWATVSGLDWVSDNHNEGHKACVTDKKSGIDHHVTLKTIVVGVGRTFMMTEDEAAMKFLPESLRTKLFEAFIHADANRIDSHDATDILQLGIFGQLRYF